MDDGAARRVRFPKDLQTAFYDQNDTRAGLAFPGEARGIARSTVFCTSTLIPVSHSAAEGGI
jgi:hypothetical protein